MLAADRGVSADDAYFYPDEMLFLHDKSSITFAKAWEIIQSEEYQTAVYEYNMYKSFGLPHAGGWKEQSVVWVALVSAVDIAVKCIEREALEKVKT